MHKNQTLKFTFFSGWLAIVALVVLALFNQQKFFAIAKSPIAHLAEKEGDVMARPENLVRWQMIQIKGELFDGDRVATGRSSRSKIGFEAGRSVTMGEETQLQITTIHQASSGNAFIINLLRGSVVADVDASCKNCAPLIVRAGGDSFTVTSGKAIGLLKLIGKKAVKFDPNGPLPAAPRPAIKSIAPTEKLLPSPAVTSPTPTLVPTVTPRVDEAKRAMQGAARAKNYAVEVNRLGTGAGAASPGVWWTFKPLSALTGQGLEFPLRQPSERPTNGTWQPLVRLSGAADASPTQVIKLSGERDDSVMIPIEKIRRAATLYNVGGIAEYVFRLTGGSVVNQGSQPGSPNFSGKSVEFKIRSFGDLPPRPWLLSLDGLLADQSNSLWFEPKKDLAPQTAPFAALLGSPDVARFFPYMRGAKAFSLTAAAKFSETGVFVVRKQVIIAQLFGTRLDEQAINRAMLTLDADFVFKGRRAALNDARSKSRTDLVQWIGALLDSGSSLYILKRSKLYPVNREFVKTNGEVAQFVDSQARAIFLEKVEILDYR